MRKAQVEAWVLRVIDDVMAGRDVEDDLVELKAEWPEPKKAARRLAGHANSAGGEPILWVIGVDEKARKLCDTERADAAGWWDGVAKFFDEQITPDPMFLAVPTGQDVTVMALLASTDRAPYVVRNPSGGTPELEVPVRRGTAVRSGHRSDLLRILVPATAIPEVEVRTATLQLLEPRNQRNDGAPQYGLSVRAEVYVEPRGAGTLILPDHRTSVEVVGVDGDVLAVVAPLALGVGGLPRNTLGRHQQVDVLETISRGANQVVVQGAGLMTVYGSDVSLDPWPLNAGERLTARFTAGIATQLASSLRFDVPLAPTSKPDGLIARWDRPDC